MKSKIHIDKKEIIITIVLAIVLSVLSIVTLNKYNEVTTVKEQKKADSLDKTLLNIKPNIEYDAEEDKYKINYQNSTPANIIKANFLVFDINRFKRPINFEEAVSEYSRSNSIFLNKDEINPSKDFILLSNGVYSYKNSIYSFTVNDDKLESEFVGEMPYFREGKARYLVPKINIVEKNGKKFIESYMYNVTKIDVLDYEFIYEDAKTGENYSLKFDNVPKGKKSKKIVAKAPKSGLIKDVVPKESFMRIVNEEGKEYNVVYDYSTNLILDLDKYDKLINKNQGNKYYEAKN